MPQMKQLVVESPDAIGRDAYERVAAIVLQDLDLVKVVEHLYIYADPMVPIFIAAGGPSSGTEWPRSRTVFHPIPPRWAGITEGAPAEAAGCAAPRSST